jgi:hypothetical protein
VVACGQQCPVISRTIAVVAVVDLIELGPIARTAIEIGVVSKNVTAQNLQELVEADVEGETLPHDGDQDILVSD